MSSVDDLIVFLRAQLDEDERVAQKADRAGLNGVSPSEPQTWYLSGNETVYSDPHGVALVTGVHGYLGEELGDHIVRHDPARVLAEVDAKRETLKFCEHLLETKQVQETADELSEYSLGRAQAGGHMLRLLALPYAGRPGYRDEWRP